jgi:hypothetical protein
MKFGLFPMILLTFAANVAVPSLGWADWAIATNGEALAGCGGQQVSRAVSSSQTSSPTIIAITDGAPSDGSCPGDSGGPTSATYLGHAAFNDVSGNAQASLAGVASIAAVYVDDVTLHPPGGFAGSTVTFGMVANYNLQVDATRGAAAIADLALYVPQFGQRITEAVDSLTSGNHSFSGLIQTGDMTFNNEPFTTQFELLGDASASVAGPGASGSASFSDPVSFILPPGWTYTLASQEPSGAGPTPTPEPSSLALLGLGLASIGFIGRRTATCEFQAMRLLVNGTRDGRPS